MKNYIRLLKLTLSTTLLLSLVASTSAQAVDGFWKDIQDRIQSKEYFRVNGSLQAGLRWNNISGITARTDPFQGRINASLLIDFLGIKGPFTAAFSDGNTTYRLPAYAFYGFSPSYKWIQLHFGDRSLNFSPYTLNGHNFKGVGVELTPGNFYFGAMHGRLRRARLAEAGAIQNLDPIYRRIGSSIKVGYDDGENKLGAVLFRARDDENSITIPDSSLLRPQENLVLEFQGQKQLGSLFNVAFNIAHSALSRDNTAPLINDPGSGLNGSILGLFKPRSSTAYNQAYNFSIGFSPKIAQFNLRFEHLGAGYRSLGTLAFLNDTEQLSLGANTTLLNNKVNLAANFGLQRNGLSNNTTTDGTRLIGSLNLGVTFNERLTSSVSLSNFNYTLRQRVNTVPFVVVDSIVIVQSNLSAQVATTYLLDTEGQSTLTFSGAYQTANTVDGDEIETTTQNDFYSLVVAYTWNQEERRLGLTLSAVANVTDFGNLQSTIYSPSLALQKEVIEDKWTLDIGGSYSGVRTNGTNSNRVLESRLGSLFEISDKQVLRFQISYVNNRSTIIDSPFNAFQDWNGSLNYRLSF
ncbi:MAG: hypothetical protein AAFZ63_17280 [Bacteroidota bacterium]